MKCFRKKDCLEKVTEHFNGYVQHRYHSPASKMVTGSPW